MERIEKQIKAVMLGHDIGKERGVSAQSWNESIYIIEINEDGTMDSLEWVEVIA